jgi:DNA-binding IclR family transcriptional regulator
MKQKIYMEKGYTIPSLQRGIRIVEAILGEENGLSALELEEEFGIPKTTIFRILHTLQHENWLEKHGERYLAGHRLIQTGLQALSGMELRRIAVPFLDNLSRETEETAHLGIWAGKQVMVAEVCDGPKHIRIACRAGSLTPSHCSSLGKVLLAGVVGSKNLKSFFEGTTLEKRTPNTITDLDALAAELDKVTAQGYAVDDREYYEDVRCVAAPVRNAFGSIVAAVGITATTLTLQESMIPEVAVKVVKIAEEISQALGAH